MSEAAPAESGGLSRLTIGKQGEAVVPCDEQKHAAGASQEGEQGKWAGELTGRGRPYPGTVREEQKIVMQIPPDSPLTR
ncbi:hypothetical protein NDU88_006775 [Pleurodeles waltl]|uniref:Uncharacterized protein n=1 Tax=Pleurodeles waltl TaxID=8319 RepID=A0AAV7N405_PLEWA|nr:hypothetical protein NDU88_006775 [Pleurodeles waltl]